MRFPQLPLNNRIFRTGRETLSKNYSLLLILFLVIVTQIALSSAMFINRILPFALLIVGIIFFLYMKNPVYAIFGVIAARLITTESLSIVRVGGFGIGLFEGAILLCFLVWIFNKIFKREEGLQRHALHPLFFILFLFQILSLSWTEDRMDAIREIVRVLLIFVSFQLIVEMIKTPEDYKNSFYVWLTASVIVVVLGLTTNWIELSVPVGDVTWKSASKGGRETGIGQNPNWYGMNIAFSVLPSFALFYITRKKLLRWLLLGACLFVVFGTVISGSRGATGEIIIGAIFVIFSRKNLWKVGIRILITILLLFSIFLIFYRDTAAGHALDRIIKRGTNVNSPRFSNWVVCYKLFFDTYGRGIGPGSKNYINILKKYNWMLYNSINRYPHGIYQGLAAHYGIFGLFFAGALILIIINRYRKTYPILKGTDYEILFICQLGSMIGYAAHGCVEFRYYDKPFWEFLAIWLACSMIAERGMNTTSIQRSGVGETTVE